MPKLFDRLSDDLDSSTCDAMFKPAGGFPLSAVKKKKPRGGPGGPGSPNLAAANR